jgi:hypothetical protein
MVLRSLCMEAGVHFQPIDLHWGVSLTASAERQTLPICFEEWIAFQLLSPDFSLLILPGDRYGTCFLPPEASAAQFTRLRPISTRPTSRPSPRRIRWTRMWGPQF